MSILNDLNITSYKLYFNIFETRPQANTNYNTENLNDCIILSFRYSLGHTNVNPEEDRKYIIENYKYVGSMLAGEEEASIVQKKIEEHFSMYGKGALLPIYVVYMLMYKYAVPSTLVMAINRTGQCYDTTIFVLKGLYSQWRSREMAKIYIDSAHAMVLNYDDIVIKNDMKLKGKDVFGLMDIGLATKTIIDNKPYAITTNKQYKNYSNIYLNMLKQDISILLRPILYELIHWKNNTITEKQYKNFISDYKKTYKNYFYITATDLYKDNFGGNDDKHINLDFSDVTPDTAKNYLKIIDNMYITPVDLAADSRLIVENLLLKKIIQYIVLIIFLSILIFIGIYFIGIIVNIIILINDYNNKKKYKLKHILYILFISWAFPINRYLVKLPF